MISILDKAGASILIPSIRRDKNLQESLESICKSAALFSGSKEIILSIDRTIAVGDPYYELAGRYPFVQLLVQNQSLGGPYARRQALQNSRYRTIIFTDDDCWVPTDWVTQMYDLVQKFGIVTGLVKGRSNRLLDQCEALIDRYRIEAKDSSGHAKFISFPNFGIQRELLPENPFDSKFKYNLGSLELGNQLRLQGWHIFPEANLVVETEYPTTFWKAAGRKLRHAEGIAFVHHRLGHEAWDKLEMGSHKLILWRWTKISFTAPFSIGGRFYFFALNMCYAFPLMIYYTLGHFRKWR